MISKRSGFELFSAGNITKEYLTLKRERGYNLTVKTTGNRQGFTLIENIIVIILLPIIVASPFNLYPSVLNSFVNQENCLIADNYAYSQIEDLREIAHTGASRLNDPALTEAIHANQTVNIILLPGFTLQYTVVDHAWPGEPASPAEYKTVTVTCTHTASGYQAILTADIAP